MNHETEPMDSQPPDKTGIWARMNTWDWEMTKWSQRVLKTGVGGTAIFGAVLAYGVKENDPELMKIGFGGTFLFGTSSSFLGAKEFIESKVRKANNLNPPPKNT